MEGKNKVSSPVVLAKTAVFNGVLRFTKPVCIQGKFSGTIEATGELTVDRSAVVDADRINVSSIVVLGRVSGNIFAEDKVDLFPGAEVSGDISAQRLRIADGVLFEGQCSMVDAEKDIDIFSHSQDEIKDVLQG
jgi:cytoskeletal protein CcmA (bactofilin family)